MKTAGDIHGHNRHTAPGKAEMQIPAVQVSPNHITGIGSEKPILMLIAVIPRRFQVFKMMLGTLEVMGLARMARLIEVI